MLTMHRSHKRLAIPAARSVLRRIPAALVLAGALPFGAIVGLLLTAVSPAYLGYHQTTIYGGSMGDALPLGSVAVTETVKADAVREGDVIAITNGAGSPVVMHRVVTVVERPDGRYITTRGDSNSADDPGPRLLTGEGDRLVYFVPWIGFVLHWARTTVGSAAILSGAAIAITLSMFAIPDWPGRRRSRSAAAQGLIEWAASARSGEVFKFTPPTPPPTLERDLRLKSQRRSYDPGSAKAA